MPRDSAVLDKTLNSVNQDITVAENQLANIKNEIELAKKQKDELDKQIAQRRNDTQSWLDEQRKEYRKEVVLIEEERKKIAIAKDELSKSITEHNAGRVDVDAIKSQIEIEKSRLVSIKNRYENFVQAVNRAYSLLQ